MSDWVEGYSDKHKRKYWKHKTTGEVSWKPPSGVTSSASASSAPNNDEWVEGYSDKHKRKYWKHKTTGEVSWKAPPAGRAMDGATSDAESIVSTATPRGGGSDDWVEGYSDKHKRKYWKHKTTGEVSWKAPPIAPAAAAATPVEGEWVEGYSDKHKRKYWKHKTTGEVSWKAPPAGRAMDGGTSDAESIVSTATPRGGGSDDWVEGYSDKHKRKYWKHKTTGEVSWKAPPAAPAAAAAAPSTDGGAVAASEWVEGYSDKHKRKYWKHKTTGEVSWKAPPAGRAMDGGTSDAESIVSTATPRGGGSDDWVEGYSDKHKRKYWKHKTTGEVSWKAPPAAPAAAAAAPSTDGGAVAASEWVEGYSDKHKRKYWKHKTTGEVSWKAPPAAPAASSSAVDSDSISGVITGSNPSTITAATTPTGMISLRAVVQLVILPATTRNVALLQVNRENSKSAPSVTILTITDLPAFLKKYQDVSNVSWESLEFIDRRDITLESISEICCNRSSSQIELTMLKEKTITTPALTPAPLTVKTGEEEAQGATTVVVPPSALSSVVVKETIKLALVFSTPLQAHAWFTVLYTLWRDTAGRFADCSAEDHSAKFGPLLANPEMEPLLAAHVNQTLPVQLRRIDANLSLADGLLMSNGGDTTSEMSEKMKSLSKEVKEKLLITPASVSKAKKVNVADSIPSNGIVVLQVDEGIDALAKVNSQLGGAVSGLYAPCWVSLDATSQTISFHEHGPTYAATFILNCVSANLHIPDLSEAGAPLICSIQGTRLMSIYGEASVSISLLFKTTAEFRRWVLALSSVTGTLTWQCGDTLHTHHQEVLPAERALLGTTPARFLSTATAAETLLCLENALAERELASEAIRHVHISGAALKSLRLAIASQRLIIQSVESKEISGGSVTEGSVILSVNGLSAIGVPPNTVQRFITEMPKQMPASLVIARAPRGEFGVSLVELRTDQSDGLNNLSTSSSQVGNLLGTATQTLRKSVVDTSQITKVIERKRSIIFLPGSNPGTSDSAALNGSTTATPNTPVTEQMTLEKLRQSTSSEVSWSPYILTISGGRIALRRRRGADNGAGDASSGAPTDVAYTFYASSVNLRIVTNRTATTTDDLWISLSDGRIHVALRLPNPRLVSTVLRSLVIVCKLGGGLTTDLSWCGHQAEKWAILNTKDMPNTLNAPQALATRSPTISPASIAKESENTSLLRAAERLASVINRIEPKDTPALPTVTAVEMLVSEIRNTSIMNHDILAELLLDPDAPVAPQAAPTQTVTSPPVSTTTEPDLLTENLADNILEEDPKDEPINLRARRMSTVGALARQALAPPPSAELPAGSSIASPKPTRSAMRSSVTTGGSAPAMGITGFSLSSDESSALAIILSHLRRTPNDAILLSSSMVATIDHLVWAQILVCRLHSHWSTDPRQIGSLIHAILCAKSPSISQNSAPNIMRTITDSTTHRTPLNTFLSYNDFSATLMTRSVVMSGGAVILHPLLHPVLYELVTRPDIATFFKSLTDDLRGSALTHLNSVSELCASVVAPVVRRLESVISSGSVPIALCATLRALSDAPNTPVRPRDFFSVSLTPYVLSALQAQRAMSDCSQEWDNFAEQLSELLALCCDADATRRTALCLADAAALARYQWLFGRSIDALVQSDTAQLNAPMGLSKSLTIPSPVALLIGSGTGGRPAVLDGYTTLRHSELLFILTLLDRNSMAGESLSSASRRLQDALRLVQSRETMTRLRRFSPVVASTDERYVLPSYLDSDGGIVIAADSSITSDGSWTDLLAANITVNAVTSRTGVFRSTAPMQSVFLDTPSEPLFWGADTGESPAAQELSSIAWMLSAARAAQRRVYEDTTGLSKSAATARELIELSESLQAREASIRQIHADWRRVQVYKELVTSWNGQLTVLRDALRARRRTTSDSLTWTTLSQSHAPSSTVTTNNGPPVHLILTCALKPSLITAEGGTSSRGATATWSESPSDEYAERALTSAFLHDMRLTSQLLSHSSSTPKLANRSIIESVEGGEVASRLAKASSPMASRSSRWSANADGLPSAVLPSVTGGVNPLWAVMQSVFQSNGRSP